MSLYIAPRDEVDTFRITGFLLCQDGVIDADVWIKNQAVLARVTVADHQGLDETDLRHACERELGAAMTPNMILLQRALRPAA